MLLMIIPVTGWASELTRKSEMCFCSIGFIRKTENTELGLMNSKLYVLLARLIILVNQFFLSSLKQVRKKFE